MVATIGSSTPIAARNSAVLLFGFASALRRSSLARLRLADLWTLAGEEFWCA